MGNTESSKKQSGQQYHKTMPFNTKRILILHKSSASQLQATRNFRDALIAKANGSVRVTNFVNVADKNEIPKSLAWLNELNNVVIICLKSEAIEEFQKIVLEKGFADHNGQLHKKVFTVSFGESLTSKWPPKGLIKGSKDLRDFHFGFSDEQNLRPQDFEGSLRLTSLIAAIKGTP